MINIISKPLEFDDELKEENDFYKNLTDQYKGMYERKREKLFKGLNLFNKKEVEKATKHINNEMDEAAEEFYKTKKEKEKDDGLSLWVIGLLNSF